MTRHHSSGSLNRPRGLGLIEILVALVLGLFLVGAAASLFVGQLTEQRRRLLDVRVTQELRSAAALIERDLRRAGHWAAADQSLWLEGSATTPALNPYPAIHPASGDDSVLGYSYVHDRPDNNLVDANERLGFRVNSSSRTLEMRLAGAALAPASGDSWQPLTDPATVRITRLAIHTTATAMDLGARCTLPCPSAAAGCPPIQTMRVVTIDLEGRAVTDAAIQRALRSTVRLRTDVLAGQCPQA
ncbi:MAG: hypothetical protein ABI574_15655 [Burkholderiales bacterium]